LGAHELKHYGYRLQIHVRDGWLRLYTMNGAVGRSVTRRITRDASRGSAITEVVWPGVNGVADFAALHSRYNNGRASACVVICLCSMVTAFGRNRLPNARPCCVKYWAALTQKQYKPGRLVLCFVHRITSYMHRIVVLLGVPLLLTDSL
jgi:hypothetical protein